MESRGFKSRKQAMKHNKGKTKDQVVRLYRQERDEKDVREGRHGKDKRRKAA